ncbi:MAG: glycosyltransferase family 39 protein [Candidatus Shapirobacteria bacterium]|nr:glycosyltransferase family 39 protein [Candidatus Shapirobacteria bacterium]
MINFLSKNKFWIITFLFFFLLRLPSLFEPYWYGDEGIYLTLGQGIRKGLILYQQIHDNKPPTLYYLAALGQTVFGFRLLLSLVMIPTIIYFYKLCLHFFKPKVAKISTFILVILTSIPFIEGNIANAEIFMILPTIVGFLFFLNAKKNFHYLISGILLGLAFTIKIPVFIEIFFLVIWIFIQDFDNLKQKFWTLFFRAFLLGIGFLIPTLIYLFYFYYLHALIPFLSSALLQNFSYLSSWATGTQTASASSGGLVNRLIILLLSWLILFFLKSKKIISPQITFVSFWLTATIFGVLLSTRPYPHYLIQMVPPLILLISFLFTRNKIANIGLIILSLFFVIFIIKKYNFYFYPNIKYYLNFYLSKDNTSYLKSFGPRVETNEKISHLIKENTNPEDRIFVWGDEPYVYAMSDRLPVGRYTVAYHIIDFNGYKETIDSFKANLPKFVVYYPMTNRPFEQLDNLLQNYYSLNQVFDSSVLVFQKR